MDEKILERFSNYSILCVEDEAGIRKRLVNTLKYYFDDVIDAANGEEGYELYLEYKPDIILSDIEMPEQNGIEMVKKIREKDFHTIIIMVTAYSNEEYLLDLINLNINHYILKPINSENLFSGIIKALGERLTSNLIFTQDCYFDVQRYEFIYQESVVPLRKRDKEFLLLLYRYKNQIVSYEIIDEYIWKDKNMTMSALKTFIKELRQKLPINLIENISQTGYKLNSIL
ncbi:DNA-binding response regulator [Halarcobacter ebronensis]|uniref:DNA-binding response regulator n=1 Tax=Halarcobacter ebronensis TaxID=1462615 RepID=A0A4Q0YCK8_9BACT|nr:response regulator [Halarcobacter ebronensis]RXJ68127.1 DNA-binding response regulator [Halarcobacter ebronensis]